MLEGIFKATVDQSAMPMLSDARFQEAFSKVTGRFHGIVSILLNSNSIELLIILFPRSSEYADLFVMKALSKSNIV